MAEKLRGKIESAGDFELRLAEMDEDQDVQRELKEIESDFRRTEFDGLEK